MNTDKLFLNNLFKNLFTDPFLVKYWDGDVQKYGKGTEKFEIIFNAPLAKEAVLADPSMAFGEGYMTKKIDIKGSVEKVIQSLYRNKESFLSNSSKYMKLIKAISNNIKVSKANIQHHYDIGNDFYKLWLDETMTYSCGYFKTPVDSLEQAQRNKVEHILKKLALKPGQTLLDIGCGWGELILTAAKEYGVKAMGVTLSKEQYTKVQERIIENGLIDLVEVHLCDYREIEQRQFDRVLSVGMAEHLGKNHIGEYFSTVEKLLADGGVSMLHCITGLKEGGTNTWIDKYIFPGGYIPSIKELVSDIIGNNFYLVDMESLRRHYGKTLELWAENFENALDEISKSKDEAFIRMWRLYLNSCAASFNCGNIDIHQILFTKGVNNNLPWTRDYIYAE